MNNDFGWGSHYVHWVMLTLAGAYGNKVAINLNKVSSFYEADINADGAIFKGTCIVMDNGDEIQVVEGVGKIWEALDK